MLFRAPEIKIGLENDIMCGLIDVQNMPEMDMMICEPWELTSLNIIGRTNELVLYVIVIGLIVA